MDFNQASTLHLILSAILSAIVGYVAFKYQKDERDKKEKENQLTTRLKEQDQEIEKTKDKLHAVDLAMTDKASRTDLEKTTDMLFKAVADLRTELKADILASTETILNFIGKGGGKNGSI